MHLHFSSFETVLSINFVLSDYWIRVISLKSFLYLRRGKAGLYGLYFPDRDFGETK